jgi:hypothetical protein
MDTFQSLYDPKYDGFAFASGFRNGDIIRGIDSCFFGSAKDAEDEKIDRKIILVDNFSDFEWKSIVATCENIAPLQPINMVIERISQHVDHDHDSSS